MVPLGSRWGPVGSSGDDRAMIVRQLSCDGTVA